MKDWKTKGSYEGIFSYFGSIAVWLLLNPIVAIIKLYEKGREITNREGVAFMSLFTKEELTRFKTYRSRGIEMRGIWHMPKALIPRFGFDGNRYDENTLKGIQAALDDVRGLGFNTILIETTVNAYTIYPSKVGTIHPDYKDHYYGPEYGNDYLKCFIGEAHKRGLDVHAWTTTMRAGSNYKSTVNESLPQAIKLEWLARGYHNEYGLSGKYGELMWLDPSNEEVVDYILRLYEELLNNYDFDGIELDAIRYPVSNIMSVSKVEDISDFGYTENALKGFKEQYQFDGDLKKEIIDNIDLKKKWISYRTELINQVVEKLYSLVRSLKPNLPFSAAVFNNPESSITTVCQDWADWCQKEWFDFISPMAYSTDHSIVQKSYDVTETLVDGKAFNLQGLGSIIFSGTYETHFEQMELINNAGGLGSILFSTRQLLKDDKTMAMLEIIHQYDQAISPLKTKDEITEEVSNKIKNYAPKFALDSKLDVNISNLKQLRDTTFKNDKYIAQVIDALIKTLNIKDYRENLIKNKKEC